MTARNPKELMNWVKDLSLSFSYAEEITYEDIFAVIEEIAKLIKS